MKSLIKICVAMVMISASATFPAVAQNAQNAAPPAGDEPSNSDIIATAMGCAATYDYLLQATPGDNRMIAARNFAISIYKQYSNDNDAQVAEEVVRADKLLVDMINEGELTIAEVRPTCDALFMDGDASAASAGTT